MAAPLLPMGSHVKGHASPQSYPVPPLPSCECSRGAAWQHVPVAWRLRCRSPHLPGGLSVRLPSLPTGPGAPPGDTAPPCARSPIPCTHAYTPVRSGGDSALGHATGQLGCPASWPGGEECPGPRTCSSMWSCPNPHPPTKGQDLCIFGRGKGGGAGLQQPTQRRL